MKNKNALMLMIVAIALPGITLARQFDTDCGVGSRCIKSRGQIKGVCVR
jgi:hypothetical protein